MMKVAHLTKQQNQTPLVPGERTFYFTKVHIHICFHYWVCFAWHHTFVLEKTLGALLSVLSWTLEVSLISNHQRSLGEKVALSYLTSFVDLCTAFWKASWW